MTRYPDPPEGWHELRARMARAKTPEQINEILEEMNQTLSEYEAKQSRDRRLDESTGLHKERASRNSA